MNASDSMKLARAILDLAHGVSSAREVRSLSVGELAAQVGVEALDIEMMEEGMRPTCLCCSGSSTHLTPTFVSEAASRCPSTRRSPRSRSSIAL